MNKLSRHKVLFVSFFASAALSNCASESSVLNERVENLAPNTNNGVGSRVDDDRRKPDTSGGTTVSFGDFNGDGKVGGADFLLLRQSYGLKSGDSGFDTAYDFDGDGIVGFTDFAEFRKNYQSTGSDINQDGKVDDADFAIFQSSFGSTESDENYRVECDFGLDGKVGFDDFVQLRQDYNTN